MRNSGETGAARLLVVEDDPAMRDVMVEVLTDAGYTVKATSGGSKALLELFRPPSFLKGFSVVVTDLRMPGLDGIELIRVIRDIGGPPVVLVSAFATSEVREEARAAGAVDILSKPFDSAQLLDSIRAAL